MEKIKNLKLKEDKINYIGFYDKSFGVIVGASGFIQYSTNGGKSWEETEIPLEEGYIPVSVYLNEAEDLITVSNAKLDIILYQYK